MTANLQFPYRSTSEIRYTTCPHCGCGYWHGVGESPIVCPDCGHTWNTAQAWPDRHDDWAQRPIDTLADFAPASLDAEQLAGCFHASNDIAVRAAVLAEMTRRREHPVLELTASELLREHGIDYPTV